MKNLLLVFVSVLSLTIYAQDRPQRGPYNTLPGGVVDGVAIQDEVPVRSKVEYEYVRASDVAWQKRVFSRIDAREIMNHDIFFPYDAFDGDLASGSMYRPSNASEIDDPTWNKDQRRWSLWTVIMRHVFLGDLTVYRVASEFYPAAEDGYSLKYPIQRQGQNDYFEVKKYQKDVTSLLASGGLGAKLRIYRPQSEDTMDVIRTEQSLQEYLDSLRSDSDYEELFGIDQTKLQDWWNLTTVNSPVRKDAVSMFVPSNNIVAYHIKEDWYFDKERSVLDKRIIAIAPVARYTYEEPEEGEQPERGELLVYDQLGKPFKFDAQANEFLEYPGRVEEREMFWLYFDELRNVMVNYYVYNDQNDAQWMSFDDLFWKRKFSSTIYRVSDKFDREIQDYKFGVDALYEAEKVKESIRDWEHNLWHF
jgi:gliding motility associated protien GldN